MKSSTFPKIYYNDLSDNGKSFEFGYDSSSDTYGYYKNGVFTGFGGGGGLSTKCIVKELYYLPNGNTIVMYFEEDGTYKIFSNGYTETLTYVSEHSECFDLAVHYSTYYYMDITYKKDGYYITSGNGVSDNTPTLHLAGETASALIWHSSTGYAYALLLMYVGTQLGGNT